MFTHKKAGKNKEKPKKMETNLLMLRMMIRRKKKKKRQDKAMICNDNGEMTGKKTLTTAKLSLDHNPPFMRVERDLSPHFQIPPMSVSFE